MGRLLTFLIFLGLFLYLGDFLLIQYRVSRNRNPYGTVQVEQYYAVPDKNGKTDFMDGQPDTETCVNSLFPHFGDNPCWYLSRKKNERVDL